MPAFGTFVSSVLGHWISLLAGCVVTVILGLLEKYVLKSPVPLKVYSVVIGSLIFFACYQAWLDQYTSAEGRRIANIKLQREISTAGVPTAKEPTDSLRRRTLALVNDVEAFRNERDAHHPPHSNGDAKATGEQSKVNEASLQYDVNTESLCLAKFENRTRGIIQELKAAGVDIGPGPSGYFEAMIEQRRCVAPFQYQQFRDLAYHVDAAGKLVGF